MTFYNVFKIMTKSCFLKKDIYIFKAKYDTLTLRFNNLKKLPYFFTLFSLKMNGA